MMNNDDDVARHTEQGVKIERIFDFQAKLQKAIYGKSLPSFEPELIKNYALGIFTELGEVLAIDKSWKPWKHTQQPYDQDELIEEIADLWIFVIDLSMAYGLELKDVISAIEEKQEILVERHMKEGK